MRFYITGAFSVCTKDDILRLIKTHGGRTLKNLGPDVYYMIAGIDADISVVQSAKNMDVNVITEEYFLRMCGIYKKLSQVITH